MATTPVRESDDKGRHTTTHRELVRREAAEAIEPLPEAGILLVQLVERLRHVAGIEGGADRGPHSGRVRAPRRAPSCPSPRWQLQSRFRTASNPAASTRARALRGWPLLGAWAAVLPVFSVADLFFNLTESYAGDDTMDMNIAAYLELLDCKYTGAGPHAMYLAQDKALAKKIFAFHGIKTPYFATSFRGKLDHSHDIEFPLIVKPTSEDGSIGIDSTSAEAYSVGQLIEDGSPGGIGKGLEHVQDDRIGKSSLACQAR